MRGKLAVEKFGHRRNIEHYRKLLAQKPSAAERERWSAFLPKKRPARLSKRPNQPPKPVGSPLRSRLATRTLGSGYARRAYGTVRSAWKR